MLNFPFQLFFFVLVKVAYGSRSWTIIGIRTDPDPQHSLPLSKSSVVNSRYNKKAGSTAISIVPTPADFSCSLWKAERVTIANFLLHLELHPPPLETGNSNTLNHLETRNINSYMVKLILISQNAGLWIRTRNVRIRICN